MLNEPTVIMRFAVQLKLWMLTDEREKMVNSPEAFAITTSSPGPGSLFKMPSDHIPTSFHSWGPLPRPVQVTVELGSCHLPMRDVLQLNAGSVVQLDKVADAPVELYVNRKLVGRGEVVVVENRFGIKITELVGVAG